MSLVSPTKKAGVMEEGSEGGMRDRDDGAPDRAAGAEKDIAGVDHVTGPVPIPDPDHQLQEQDAIDPQSGTNQRDFLSQWSRKSTMEKFPVSCNLGALCSWKGSEVVTRVLYTSHN